MIVMTRTAWKASLVRGRSFVADLDALSMVFSLRSISCFPGLLLKQDQKTGEAFKQELRRLLHAETFSRAGTFQLNSPWDPTSEKMFVPKHEEYHPGDICGSVFQSHGLQKRFESVFLFLNVLRIYLKKKKKKKKGNRCRTSLDLYLVQRRYFEKEYFRLPTLLEALYSAFLLFLSPSPISVQKKKRSSSMKQNDSFSRGYGRICHQINLPKNSTKKKIRKK